MTAARNEAGMTLVEMMVGVFITLIIFGAALTTLEVFQRQASYTQTRNETQDFLRNAVDRLQIDLRNIAVPGPTNGGVLELAGPYDLVFQTVTSSAVAGSNSKGLMRVRYCVDATTPSNEVLWRETMTTTASSYSAIPSTSTCPVAAVSSSTTSWQTATRLASFITNENGSLSRPMFYCLADGSSSNLCSSNSTTNASVTGVGIDMFANEYPSQKQPGEIELRSSVELRNALGDPVANFTGQQIKNSYVLLDGSSSSDPNNQVLTYQWYRASGCPTASAISGATSVDYTDGPLSSGTYSYSLKVTDTAGLSTCSSQTYSVTVT